MPNTREHDVKQHLYSHLVKYIATYIDWTYVIRTKIIDSNYRHCELKSFVITVALLVNSQLDTHVCCHLFVVENCVPY